jgi:hypothetical protein
MWEAIKAMDWFALIVMGLIWLVTLGIAYCQGRIDQEHRDQKRWWERTERDVVANKKEEEL